MTRRQRNESQRRGVSASRALILCAAVWVQSIDAHRSASLPTSHGQASRLPAFLPETELGYDSPRTTSRWLVSVRGGETEEAALPLTEAEEESKLEEGVKADDQAPQSTNSTESDTAVSTSNVTDMVDPPPAVNPPLFGRWRKRFRRSKEPTVANTDAESVIENVAKNTTALVPDATAEAVEPVETTDNEMMAKNASEMELQRASPEKERETSIESDEEEKQVQKEEEDDDETLPTDHMVDDETTLETESLTSMETESKDDDEEESVVTATSTDTATIVDKGSIQHKEEEEESEDDEIEVVEEEDLIVATEQPANTKEEDVDETDDANDESTLSSVTAEVDEETQSTKAGNTEEEEEEAEYDNDESIELEAEEDEEEENETEMLTARELYTRTQTLRTQGKELHDSRLYEQAAQSFALAAEGLDHLQNKQRQSRLAAENEDADDMAALFEEVDSNSMQEDYATCRLHQALCHTKDGSYQEAVEACNFVILATTNSMLSPAVRARALYRRARARMALHQLSEAKQDARSAAFLGDTKAVDLYGQLLRDNTSGDVSSSSSMTSMPDFSSLGGFGAPSPAGADAPDSAGNEANLLSALLGAPSSSSGGDDPASLFGSSAAQSLFSQALGASSGSSSGEGSPFSSPFGLSSLLGSALGGATGGGAGKSALVKSIVSGLDNDQIHDKICSTLQGASKSRIQQYAGMAGMDVSESQAERLANVCQGVKPRHLKTTVSIGKRLWYVGQILRKTSAVLTRYRPIFVLIFLLAWIKTLFVSN